MLKDGQSWLGHFPSFKELTSNRRAEGGGKDDSGGDFGRNHIQLAEQVKQA